MNKKNNQKPYLDVKDLSLDQWLDLVFTPDDKRKFCFIDYEFPSDAHSYKYIESINTRGDDQVKKLLRYFLIPSGSLGHDSKLIHHLSESDQLLEQIITTEFGKRLIRGRPWEGITWILDLLPAWPKPAIDALDAYIRAHAHLLPDGRFRGLNDTLAVIRAKYLAIIQPREVLNCITSRDFELLIAALYRSKGYKPQVTPQSRDGGVDVICKKKENIGSEKIFIECKHHTGSIGVPIVRQLAGVVSHEGATRDIIATSSYFTKPAIDFAEKTGRVHLLDFAGLNRELNTYVSTRWSDQLSLLIAVEHRYQMQEAA